MLCRVLLKRCLNPKPPLTLNKGNGGAHIHTVCPHSWRCTLITSRYSKFHRRNIFCSDLQLRFESSAPPTRQLPSTQNESTILDPIPDPPKSIDDLVQSTIESGAGEPTFSSLGLGGVWPPGWVQTALEFFHVDLGLPWWGAVVLGTVIIRVCMFPIVIKSQRNAATLANNMPELQEIQMRITDARQRGDKFSVAKNSAELMKFMQEKNVNPLKNLIPVAIQAPVFISVFMGLRGMSNLPVDSLRTGGILWFVDLTLPDQFYLLPLITSATMYLTLKVGTDGAVTTGQTNQNAAITKYVMKALPVIMIPFIINFPGLILTYWTTSNFLSLIQVGILRIPKVRDFCKIEKRIQHKKSDLPVDDKGFIKNVKEAWANMKITSELSGRERADKMAFYKAGRDPVRKTYKYDPTKVAPSPPATAIQAKKRS